MKRERFYEIPSSAWVHCKQPLVDEETTPEELVRQWCAHELIRAYGYRVTELSFEHTVKVGSKSYRIDILIVRDGRPFAVVECKEPKHKQHEKALQQAESYAVARGIGCEFVLYTNGDTWLVRRLIDQHWTPALDLPTAAVPARGNRIDELLWAIQLIEPILAQLDEPLAKKDAHVLLGGMQQFFHGQNLLTQSFDKSLVSATDNLLRVLWARNDDRPYRLGKFTGASRLIADYGKRSQCGHEIISDYRAVESIFWFSELGATMRPLCEEANHGLSPNWQLLRFIRALLSYGRQIDESRGTYPAIPPEIWHTLRSVLEFGFLDAFGIKLPDSLETKTDSDMKNFCRGAWERLQSEDRTN